MNSTLAWCPLNRVECKPPMECNCRDLVRHFRFQQERYSPGYYLRCVGVDASTEQFSGFFLARYYKGRTKQRVRIAGAARALQAAMAIGEQQLGLWCVFQNRRKTPRVNFKPRRWQTLCRLQCFAEGLTKTCVCAVARTAGRAKALHASV